MNAETHDFFEIVAAAEESHHGESVVDKSFGTVGIAVFADDVEPEFIFIFIFFTKFSDAVIKQSAGIIFGDEFADTVKKFDGVIGEKCFGGCN